MANLRTLEQKISDAGPNPQRVNPHLLTTAKTQLLRQGTIHRHDHANTAWFSLDCADPAAVQERLTDELIPVYTQLHRHDLLMRTGQALEIAVYRSLIDSGMEFFGAFEGLEDHDDSTLYKKEEPPSVVRGNEMRGRLDFFGYSPDNIPFAIEVKNIREWIYPDRPEVRDLLLKATAIDAVPVLIARRIPFVTFHLLHLCGAIVHQTFNQLLPAADLALADLAKHKNNLGFHDIRTGNTPDKRMTKFIGTNLPAVLPKSYPVFLKGKDLLRAFASQEITYRQFAAELATESDDPDPADFY